MMWDCQILEIRKRGNGYGTSSRGPLSRIPARRARTGVKWGYCSTGPPESPGAAETPYRSSACTKAAGAANDRFAASCCTVVHDSGIGLEIARALSVRVLTPNALGGVLIPHYPAQCPASRNLPRKSKVCLKFTSPVESIGYAAVIQ